MNAFAYRKIITPRRLRLDYVSPGICEGDFSSTGLQQLSLLPLFVSNGPTGLIMEPYFGKYRLQWNHLPGALCYSIYRLADPLNPFSPFILVAECIPGNFYIADDGVYCVTAITPEGETECSASVNSGGAPVLPMPAPPPEPVPEPSVPDPAPPPDIPGTCGDGSPAVPSTLLEELEVPEVLAEASANGATSGSTDFIMPSGLIIPQWISGYVWDDCTLKVPPTPIRDAFIKNAWLVYDGDIEIFGTQFGCFGATGTPPNCTPTVETQVLTEYPDDGKMDHSVLGCASCGPRIFNPSDPRVGQTWTFTVPGSTQGGVCPNGGTQTMKCLRTHQFIPQPSALTIFNFASIKDELFCVTGPDAGPQWNGVIDDSVLVAEPAYQCIENNGTTYVGNVRLVSANVLLVAGSKWTIQIIGEVDGGWVNIFTGEKRYGQTAQGNYGRNSGCSTLGCVTLI